jgi:hypothetical protein
MTIRHIKALLAIVFIGIGPTSPAWIRPVSPVLSRAVVSPTLCHITNDHMSAETKAVI